MNTRTLRAVADTPAARTIDFDGHPVTAVRWRGRDWWVAAQVGAAVGYAEGRYLVDKVRGEWAGEFIDGRDVAVLRGPDLAAFRTALDSGGSPESTTAPQRRGARSLVILSESGIDLALVLARTDAGRRLRRILVDEVIPQLRATGAAVLPGAIPVPAPIDGPAMVEMVRAMMREAGAALRAQLLAELRGVQPANHLPDALPFLDRRARSLVLAPILSIARIYAGGDRRRVAQERGRIEWKLRSALNWHSRWCFYPTHELGRVSALIEAEAATANRVAAELARARQLDLVSRPRLPAQGRA